MKHSFGELGITSNIHPSVENESNMKVDDGSMIGNCESIVLNVLRLVLCLALRCHLALPRHSDFAPPRLSDVKPLNKQYNGGTTALKIC